MTAIFRKPKRPPPIPEQALDTLTAQEKAAQQETVRQKNIAATGRARKKGGIMGALMEGGARPDYLEKDLKNKLGGGSVRNPRGLG